MVGDGNPKNFNNDFLPKWDLPESRTSTGIYLGMADNVVADCNINFCKVGIHARMGGNRIRGNHVTAGIADGSLFDCILIDSDFKGTALIQDNYIDNGRLNIRVGNTGLSKLNYVLVTGNLFYRGYNHPAGSEFNNIVISPEVEDSMLCSLLISGNKFYIHNENLNGESSRVITPIAVNASSGSLDLDTLDRGVIKDNLFTECPPKYVVNPVGTENKELSNPFLI